MNFRGLEFRFLFAPFHTRQSQLQFQYNETILDKTDYISVQSDSLRSQRSCAEELNFAFWVFDAIYTAAFDDTLANVQVAAFTNNNFMFPETWLILELIIFSDGQMRMQFSNQSWNFICFDILSNHDQTSFNNLITNHSHRTKPVIFQLVLNYFFNSWSGTILLSLQSASHEFRFVGLEVIVVESLDDMLISQ